MDYLNRITAPLGGIKKYGIVCAIIFVIYMIAGGVSAVSKSTMMKEQAQAEVQASIEASQALDQLVSQIPGTYLGHNGSMLVLKSDHSAFYFYRNVSTDNTWTFDNGTLTVSFPSIGGCNTSAALTSVDDLSNFNLVGITADDVYCWDAETFSRYSDSQADIDEGTCRSIISSELNITFVETAPETETTTAATEGSTTDFRAFMDEYEALVNDYVDLYQQVNTLESDDYAGAAQVLIDYADIMERYTNLQAQIEQIDESSLSADDALYYIEVMSRVNAQLATVQ